MQQKETPLLQRGPRGMPCLRLVSLPRHARPRYESRQPGNILGIDRRCVFSGQCCGMPVQRPSPGSPRFFRSLWQLAAFDARENAWSWQRAEHQPCSPPQKKENRDRRRGVEARRGLGGFISPSHGLTVSTGLGSTRTEPLGLQELKTKGRRKRNSCLDKHKVEKVIGRGIWAPRTFSNHKFSIAVLKPGNLSWLSEIYYLRSRQGQFLASSLIPTLSLLRPRSALAHA